MLSVIYLNYNRCSDLKRSLTKIFEQDFKNYEVIVVDQNSTDGSREMIKLNFPTVKLYELEKNLGVAGGRNFGASNAKGDYLVFIDDDAEFVNNDSLKKVELIFDNNNDINIIAFNIFGHPERIEKNLFFSVKNDRFVNSYIGCGHAIRKDIFYKLNGYSTDLFFWGEEIEFALKSFTLNNNKILFKGDIILFHRVTQIQRLKWKDGRFYYKVRNRLSIMLNLLPKPYSYIYILYYCFVYLIRAVQLNDLSSYYKGIKDFSNFKLSTNYRLKVKDLLKYYR